MWTPPIRWGIDRCVLVNVWQMFPNRKFKTWELHLQKQNQTCISFQAESYGVFWGGEEVGVEEKGGNLYLEWSWWLLLVDAGKHADYKNCGSSSTAKWSCHHFACWEPHLQKDFLCQLQGRVAGRLFCISVSVQKTRVSLALRLSYLWNLGTSSCFLWTTINYLESKMHVLLMAMLVSEDCSLMVQRQAWIHHGLVNRALIRGGLASLCSSWHSLQHSVLMCWWALLLA